MASKKRKAQEAFSSRPSKSIQSNDSSNSTSSAPKNAHETVLSASNKPLHANRSRFSLQDKAQHLLKTREQLPIWPHADEIRQKVRDHEVLLLVGETGSGKSTQVPQFLYTQDWCKPRHATSSHNAKNKRGPVSIGGRIAIIQPRRVAAISLATRVAAEISTTLGSASPASQVGYSVRFDNNVSPATRIKFLTDGMLLQEMLRDPWLRDYSCVIVDEVHERGVNVDLALGFLRQVLDVNVEKGSQKKEDGRGGVPLKVVVMSATADMGVIERFFGQQDSTNGNNGVNGDKVEDEWEGFSEDESAKSIDQNGQYAKHADSESKAVRVSSCFIHGRQYPVATIYSPQPVTNLLDAAMDKIIHIHQHTPLPGDILVFLSGQEMIENLESLCHTYAGTLNPAPPMQQQASTNNVSKKNQTPKLPALQILPLFASLPTHLQSRIFHPTPHFTRRIILATNIAETSITVPGIRHVIDTGKHKARLFRAGLNLDTLLSTPISQSMARQRAGRAGREAPGTCHRLYTERDYGNLEKDSKPEILSTDLSFLVLTLKAHGVRDVLGFPLLTAPPRRSLEAALEGLLNLDALDGDTGAVTEVGRKMAMLPVRPDLARALLEGSRHSEEVLEGVVSVVAALSLEEGIFLPVHAGSGLVKGMKKKMGTAELLLGTKGRDGSSTQPDASAQTNGNGEVNGSEEDDEFGNPVEIARRPLLTRHSDHLTLLNAIIAYTSPNTHDRRAWCDTHGVSHRAMSRIMDVRKQLSQMMHNNKYRLTPTTNVASLESTNGTRASGIAWEIDKKDKILKCLLAGLWPNIAILSSLAPNQPQGKEKINPNQRPPYTTLLTGQGVYVHPSSVVFGGGRVGRSSASKEEDGKPNRASASNMPRAIIFTDLIYTSKPYARNVSAVDLGWVAEMGKLS